ncbi:D-amino-acid transaminase [Providencia rettgeri]|uniref:D-amino-acid transaminase n=1 Tax=Providencia rettgeri TaxID=587 RepID=UPI00301784B1
MSGNIGSNTGQFLPEEEASVSVFDRGFLFADAVYEVTAIINGKLVDFEHHMARLQRSCTELQLSLPYDLAELKQIHLQLVLQNNIEEGLVYLQLTRGNARQRNFLYPDKKTKPTLVLFTQKTKIVENEKSKYGIKVITVDDIRWQRCDIKTVALLAASMAKEYAKQQGADDAIFVKNGYVTEGSSSNCFIITPQNQIQTRGLSNKILSGITRQAILQLAREQEIDIVEKPFSIDEMLEAKEVFITSATTLVWSVIMVNNQLIGEGKPGKLATRLRDIYLQKLK